MGKCNKHPARETSHQCAKYNIYQCRECLNCKDPKLYCKHRSACTIHVITEKKLGPDF